MRLAHPFKATPGPCAICGSAADVWLRSERRDTDADGIVLATHACHAHENEAKAQLRLLSLGDLAKMVRPSQRTIRAEQLERKARRLSQRAGGASRTGAALRGASSRSVSASAVSSYLRMQADSYAALAETLRSLM